MFTSIRDLLNRVNGDKPKVNDPNAVQVTVKETTVVIPKEALENLIRTTVREVVSQVLPALMASQRRSPFDRSPYESPFSRSRSPFGERSPMDDLDISDIIAMAMAARARDEDSENSPYDGMPSGLAEALRSMRERMNSQQDDDEDEDESPILTPEEVIAAYQARDFSNKRAELAFAVLASWDENREAYMAPELGVGVCLAAPSLVAAYKAGERVCSSCDGEDGCPVQLAFDTLVEYERMKDEEAAWAEHDRREETEPVMAGVDAEGKNEAEEPVAATSGEPEFPPGVQQW